MTRLAPLLTAALLIGSSTTSAWTQNPKQPADGAPKQNLSMDGVLQGVQAGLLQVVSEEGEPWLVKVEARPENVTYQASAEPGWLRPGMFVQFKGRFDNRGKAMAPVSQMTVFTPNAETRLGAYPDESLQATADLFGDEQAEPVAKPQAETVALNVAGRLAGAEGGKMRIAAGNAVLEAELDEKPTILVELSNIALARQGDKVSVNGWYLQKGQAWANRLLVRAAAPLEGPKKERPISPEERKKALEALEALP
ncbi:MAG: hypothetical protein KY475_06870 [Planctomycetes bacterium]|nr:hypothetical protein [Planctomycetota bacterium]